MNNDDAEKDPERKKDLLPMMTREEQIRLLNRMPTDYEPGASDELIKCISESRMNTETPEW